MGRSVVDGCCWPYNSAQTALGFLPLLEARELKNKKTKIETKRELYQEEKKPVQVDLFSEVAKEKRRRMDRAKFCACDAAF